MKNIFIINFLPEAGKNPIQIEADSLSLAIDNAVQLGIDLRYADLSNKNLFGINFANVDLSNASFECSRLYACSFQNANLTNCDFSSAGLWECFAAKANWQNVDLFETAFVATDISGCDLSQTRNMKYAVIGNLYDAIAPVDYDPVTPC